MLLGGARQEARDIYKGDDWDIERVTKASQSGQPFPMI